MKKSIKIGRTTLTIVPADEVIGCEKCGHIACVCGIKEVHLPGCRFLKSATCPVGIECEHGYDVCPICDPCECSIPNGRTIFG